MGQGLHGKDGGRERLKLDLTSTKTNPLFGRREVAFTIDERSTPSRSAVRRELAVTLRAELDQIYVRSLETRSGTRQTVGSAHIYDDPVKALEVEPQHIIERNKVPEAASAVEPAEEAPEEPAEAAPAEEPAEEAPEEPQEE